ncbi:MAG TPA: GntR family transcriptional regulator [Burkholderiales bacterium]|jgi:DNA-binding GntR family transcriptional regulator
MSPRKPATPAEAGNQPRYQEIAAVLTKGIAQGRYPVGRLLPTETELCETFDAGRHTVREALRILTDRGMIVRRRGAGTMVIATEAPNLFTHSVASMSEWLRYPQDTYRATVEAGEVMADRKLAALLKCEPEKKWFRISSVRRSSQLAEPLGWAEIYVLPKYAEVVNRGDHGSTPVHQQVEKMFGESVEHANLEIFASSIPARLARPLKVKPGSPALTVVRRYYGRKSGMFEITVSIHPENRYTYTMDMYRDMRSGH